MFKAWPHFFIQTSLKCSKFFIIRVISTRKNAAMHQLKNVVIY